MNLDQFSPRTGRRMSATSLDAYDSLSPIHLSATEQSIVDMFRRESASLTRRQIAEELGISIPTVTARVNSLIYDKGALAVHGTIRMPGRRNREELVGLPTKVQRELFARHRAEAMEQVTA